jgi:predicted nucleic acid-binding protein
MHLAMTGLFRARWSDQIHEEWIRNLLDKRDDLSREQLERTKELMNAHVLDSLVTGHESLTDGLSLPDPNDRHVLAAAIQCNAGVIVTYNLKDFPDDQIAKYGVEAQHPDQFIVHLLDLAPGRVCTAVKRQRANLKNPPRSVEELLDTLAKQRLPETVSRLRSYSDLL